MKRLRHWLFNFAAAVSLVICVATAVLWGHCYHDNHIEQRVLIPHWYVDFGALPGGLRLDLTYSKSKMTGERGRPVIYFLSGWRMNPRTPLMGDNFASEIYGFGWEAKRYELRSMESIAAREERTGRVQSATTRATELVRLNNGPGPLSYRVKFPFWFCVVALAVLPLIAVGRFLRRRSRHPAGHCLVCGYDLRATPDRCPECGAIPSAAKGAAT